MYKRPPIGPGESGCLYRGNQKKLLIVLNQIINIISIK
jgi:hypothetical protein